MKWLLLTVLCVGSLNSAKCQVEPLVGEDIKNIPASLTSGTNDQGRSETTFVPLEAVHFFATNFEEEQLEIYSRDFQITEAPGIEGMVLQTPHPYPVSEGDVDYHKLSAQIRHPIILDSESALRFDEIVLVEPNMCGEKSANAGDHVCIEGSKNNGVTWLPLTPAYNSSCVDIWADIFLGSIVGNQSYATGTQSIFRSREVSLLNNDNFKVGDTILVRFSLVSDSSLNGWGWAIDNIEIGKESEQFVEQFVENFTIYPNPCSNTINIRNVDAYGPEQVNVTISGLDGRIYFREHQVDRSTFNNRQIDLSGLMAGIYIVAITDGGYYRRTSKIIKK